MTDEEEKAKTTPLNECTYVKRSTDQATAMILHEVQVTLKSYDPVDKLLSMAKQEVSGDDSKRKAK